RHTCWSRRSCGARRPGDWNESVMGPELHSPDVALAGADGEVQVRAVGGELRPGRWPRRVVETHQQPGRAARRRHRPQARPPGLIESLVVDGAAVRAPERQLGCWLPGRVAGNKEVPGAGPLRRD